MTISVIIPTYNRADCIRRNLDCLAGLQPPIWQVIIVDASPGEETQRLVEAALAETLPYQLIYRSNPDGRGNTPNSRNLALLEATGEIIAFLDDDAFARSGWSAALLESYANPNVAGVAGRAMNGIPHEDLIRTDDIGRLRPNGTMSGNFNSNPGRCVEVDHMIGCNMSLRAEVIGRLGGFKDDFRAGPFGICEESELCIRARRLGYKLIYNPDAVADHIGAPQPGGRRFSTNYDYYHAKNNLVMVIRNYGVGARAARHICKVQVDALMLAVRKLAGALIRPFFTVAGLIVGTIFGFRLWIADGGSAERADAKGVQIRDRLVTARCNEGVAEFVQLHA